MSNKNKKPLTTIEAIRKVRGTWGNVNPVTRVVPDKTKYKRHPKYKNKEEY